MPYDPDRHHRRSIRYPEWDYAQAGAYFVTICSYEREPIFGEVIDGEMQLNGDGHVIEDELRRAAAIRAKVELDAFVVMPNHVHCIFILDEPKESQRTVPTEHPTGPRSGSIGAVIGQIKSRVTKRINRQHGTHGHPVWQRSYWDRIVRSERELDAIRRYIEDNPANWDRDPENPQ